METIGSLIDKISINELKIYHMKEQIERPDISDEQREGFNQRMSVLKVQRKDLSEELQTLFDDVFSGRKTFKLYRQLKMYNDKRFKD